MKSKIVINSLMCVGALLLASSCSKKDVVSAKSSDKNEPAVTKQESTNPVKATAKTVPAKEGFTESKEGLAKEVEAFVKSKEDLSKQVETLEKDFDLEIEVSDFINLKVLAERLNELEEMLDAGT